MLWARMLLCAALAVASAWPVAATADNFYSCRRKDGTEVITNVRIPGAKCRLVMRGAPRERPAAEASPAPAARKKKRRRRKGPWRPPGAATAPEAPPAGRVQRVVDLVEAAAERYELPVDFVLGVIHTESRFNPKALSRVGAMGLMQLMPATAGAMGVRDPWNPRDNILGGCRFLRQLADRFDGDLVKVISAYHAGGAAVARKGGIPYEATDTYVRNVLHAYYAFTDGELERPE